MLKERFLDEADWSLMENDVCLLTACLKYSCWLSPRRYLFTNQSTGRGDDREFISV